MSVCLFKDFLCRFAVKLQDRRNGSQGYPVHFFYRKYICSVLLLEYSVCWNVTSFSICIYLFFRPKIVASQLRPQMLRRDFAIVFGSADEWLFSCPLFLLSAVVIPRVIWRFPPPNIGHATVSKKT